MSEIQSTLGILLDNPVLTKHLRSKLRRSRVVLWSLIVLLICFGICSTYYARGTLLIETTPVMLILGVQAIALVFAGATEIGGAVGAARQSGILDFHRVSPTPPLWLAVGFYLGAPVLEYWLALLTLPFLLLLAGLGGPIQFFELFALEIPLIFAAFLVHSVSLLGSMISKNPKAGNRGLIVLGVFVAMGVFSAVGGGPGSLISGLAMENRNIEFFGLPIPWMIFVAIYEAILIYFLFIPSVRRMRSDRVHLYTKPQALSFLMVLTVMTLGVAWSFKGIPFIVLGMVYGLGLVAMILIATVTPDRTEYIKAVRRAVREDRHRPSPWSDFGVNRIPVFIACAIVLIASTVAWEAIEGRTEGADRPIYTLAICVGIFTIAYVGFGLQAAKLYFRKIGQSLMSVFLLLAWIFPLVGGMILTISKMNLDWALTTLAISPLAGIAICVGDAVVNTTNQVNFTPVRIAAIGPAIAFSFIFHYFLDAGQRRIDHAVRLAGGKMPRQPDPFDDVFGVPGEEKNLDPHATIPPSKEIGAIEPSGEGPPKSL